MKMRFEDFSVGDTINFKRKFEIEDYKNFSNLTGDFNPLHHNNNYAKTSGHNSTIVPLHLIIGPLSRIAGMNFPGTPSLYLSHSVKAINQLCYGETVTYSAKITSLNVAKRIITLRVIGTVGSKIIFDSELNTQALHSEWKQELDCKISKGLLKKRVLITGASGQIAAAIAKKFYDEGWSLLLQSRSTNTLFEKKVQKLCKSTVEIIKADLNTEKGLKNLLKYIEGLGDVSRVIHTASPPANASLNELVGMNYSVLKSITEVALPHMLSMQDGKIISIGSTAILKQIDGLENYAAAKSMTASYLARIDRKFSPYDVKGHVFAPDFVYTEYSKKLRSDAPSLLPSEVASKIFDTFSVSSNFMTVQNVGTSIEGRFGFEPKDNLTIESTNPVLESKKVDNDLSKHKSVSDEILFQCIKKVLPKSNADEIRNGGMGLTPGWDSLAQIQIVLEAEQKFDKKFSSAEYENLVTYESILSTIINSTEL